MIVIHALVWTSWGPVSLLYWLLVSGTRVSLCVVVSTGWVCNEVRDLIVKCGVCWKTMVDDESGRMAIYCDMTADGSMDDVHGPYVLYCQCRIIMRIRRRDNISPTLDNYQLKRGWIVSH